MWRTARRLAFLPLRLRSPPSSRMSCAGCSGACRGRRGAGHTPPHGPVHRHHRHRSANQCVGRADACGGMGGVGGRRGGPGRGVRSEGGGLQCSTSEQVRHACVRCRGAAPPAWSPCGACPACLPVLSCRPAGRRARPPGWLRWWVGARLCFQRAHRGPLPAPHPPRSPTCAAQYAGAVTRPWRSVPHAHGDLLLDALALAFEVRRGRPKEQEFLKLPYSTSRRCCWMRRWPSLSEVWQAISKQHNSPHNLPPPPHTQRNTPALGNTMRL